MNQVTCIFILAILVACTAPPAAALGNCVASYGEFSSPRPVTIQGYEGDAMEPFVSHDGHFLFFNNRNDPSVDTSLYYAERIDDLHFRFRGEVRGVNSRALDAVASLDNNGEFYFVSTRDYDATLATLFHGHFADGTVTSVTHVQGISGSVRGHINYDAEISADGDTLYYVDGIFSGGGVPDRADILIAMRTGTRFVPLPNTRQIMANVNTAARQYAPAISTDGRELFFTRLDRFILSPSPEIYHAIRDNPTLPFRESTRIEAITGFAEAPALSPDGCALYYHSLEHGHFIIKRVTR